MTTILSKIKPEDVVRDPFPHIVIKNVLELDVCERLLREFPPLDALARDTVYKSNQRLTMGVARAEKDSRISVFWKEFLALCASQDFLDDFIRIFRKDLEGLYPHFEERVGKYDSLRAGIRRKQKFKEADVLLDAQICANTPVASPSSVRGPHVDLPDKLFAGLLYLRDPRDDSQGGDLELYRLVSPQFRVHWQQFLDEEYVTLAATVSYEKNVLVLFPNSLFSLHGVTVRGKTEWPRYFVNLVGEVKKPLFDLVSHQESFLWQLFRGRRPKEY